MAVEPKQVTRMASSAIPSGAGLIGYLGSGGREACHSESSVTPENPLRQEADFPLMSQRQQAHGVVLHDKAVERNVTGGAKRNDQLAQICFHAAPEQWMRSQRVHRGLDRLRGGNGGG